MQQRAGTNSTPRTHRTPTGLVSLADYLAYVERCAQAWIAEGREQDAAELRAVGYQLLQEIEADNG